ncbi:DUF3043 domain-containing protein [Streptomyces sp. TR06-5]|uniref:DUF3043 domain-containing protein n=1 Tax=unclassified Streptomyces TaxID=2593676 RepID=UPI0039A238DE
MFRSRAKDGQAASHQVSEAEPRKNHDPEAPKGRPTPKRSDAQAQRRMLAKPPANRREAAKRSREARRADMARQRQALAGGDERYLPARDQGPVRRFARDFVDARWAVAEFFLPIAVVILILSIVDSARFQSIAFVLWVGVIGMIAVDSIGMAVRLRKALTTRFPDENRRGALFYAFTRSLQMRRMRLPKPQVARGRHP